MDKVGAVENTATVRIEYTGMTYGNALEEFKGEGVRTKVGEVSLKCLYTRNTSVKGKEIYGLTQDKEVMVYISTLELREKTGSDGFPAFAEGGMSRMAVEFGGEKYRVEKVEPLEMVFDGKEYTCLGYRLVLKKEAGLGGWE